MPIILVLAAAILLVPFKTDQNYNVGLSISPVFQNAVIEKSPEEKFVSALPKTPNDVPSIESTQGPLVLKHGFAKTILHAKSRHHALDWEIANDENFEKVIKRQTTFIYSLDAKLNKPGHFYARARGINRKGKKTEWSQTALFEVMENREQNKSAPVALRKLANDETTASAAAPAPAIVSAPVSAPALASAPTSSLTRTAAVASPATASLPITTSVTTPTPPLVDTPSAPVTKPAKVMRCEEKTPIGLRAFLGVGINFVRYTENLSNVNTSYGDLRGPSYSIGTAMDLNDHFAVEASYKDTPFIFNNSSANTSNLSGQWQTLALGISQKSDSASKWMDHFLNDEASANQVRWIYGLQLHQIPIPLFDIYHEPYLKTIQLLNASAGASWERYWNPWTRTTMLVNLQYPIGSSTSMGGASFQATPVILFDGSLGLDKKISGNYWVGLHWYGQYQNLNFSYSDNQVAASGAMSVFFSAIELRLMFDY